jgi:predicted nucleotidyltransferase component of viral defense system
VIPRANITAWRGTAPWPDDSQVEQDLVLSRALASMYRNPLVAEQALFRGGTALHKLILDRAGRYSEDIDLVQRDAGPIGVLIDAIRAEVDPWLGEPKWKRGQGRFTLVYRFETSFAPVVNMRLKVEINTREHFDVLGFDRRHYSVANPWYSGECEVSTYFLPELLGTKLRALHQRRKGRDLFDLWFALSEQAVDPGEIVRCFARYMDFGGTPVTRAQVEASIAGKLADPAFEDDTYPLLRPGLDYDMKAAWGLVHESLISRLPGDPWKGSPSKSVE